MPPGLCTTTPTRSVRPDRRTNGSRLGSDSWPEYRYVASKRTITESCSAMIRVAGVLFALAERRTACFARYAAESPEVDVRPPSARLPPALTVRPMVQRCSRARLTANRRPPSMNRYTAARRGWVSGEAFHRNTPPSAVRTVPLLHDFHR